MGDISSMYSLMAIFTMAVGGFFFVCGAANKGPIFNMDYPDKIKDEVRKVIRIAAIVDGLILIAVGLLDYLKRDELQWLNVTLWALGTLVLIGTIVYIKVKFGKQLK